MNALTRAAIAAALAVQARRTNTAPLPRPEPVRQGVSRHRAAVAPVLLRPITILRPRRDDVVSRRETIAETFRAARRVR